jgi:hypothetical protein
MTNKLIIIIFSFNIILFGCSSVQPIRTNEPETDQPLPKPELVETNTDRNILIDSTSIGDIILSPSLPDSLQLTLKISVNSNGIVKSISIEQSSGYISIDKEIINSVALWRFESDTLLQTSIHTITFIINNGKITQYLIKQLK